MANSTALTGGTRVVIDILFQKQIDLSLLKDSLNINTGTNWTFGTTAAKANLLYHASLTASDTEEAVDISGAAVSDAFGDTCSFAALKFFYVKNTDATEDLELGGLAANGTMDVLLCQVTEDTILVKPGGFFAWCDPSADGLDVSGDNDDLQIRAESDSITYELVLLGEKA